MLSLYLDSSNGLQLGLLNQSFEWLSFEKLDTKKSSTVLHGMVNKLLVANKLEMNQIQNIFSIAGPGSYTGLRLSEGLIQVFEWQKFNCYSFYHFQVPQFLGVPKGHFISHAFKNEIFKYSWENNQEKKELIKESELLLEDDTYSSEENWVVERKIISTQELILKNPSKLFSTIKKNDLRAPLYYYRELQEEFRPSMN